MARNAQGFGEATGPNTSWLRRKLPQVSLFSFGVPRNGVPLADGETCKKVRLWGVNSNLNIQASFGIVRPEGFLPYTRETLPALPGTVMARPFNKWPSSSEVFLKPLSLVPQNIMHTFQLGPIGDVIESSGNRNGVQMCDAVEFEVCVDPAQYFAGADAPFEVGPFELTLVPQSVSPQYFAVNGGDGVFAPVGTIPPAGTLVGFELTLDNPTTVDVTWGVYRNGVLLDDQVIPATGSGLVTFAIAPTAFNGTSDTLELRADFIQEEGADEQVIHGTAFFEGDGPILQTNIQGELVVQIQADYAGTWWDREWVERLLSNLRLETKEPTMIQTMGEG